MKFNYIITIHNKAALLDAVLSGVERNCASDSVIIPVLDGCSDGSEDVVKRRAKNSRCEYRITYAPDVHEIRAINIGLKVADPGCVVVLQDDVILKEDKLEARMLQLLKDHNFKLGYVSFRMGCKIKRGSLHERLRLMIKSRGQFKGPFIGETNHIAAPGDHCAHAVLADGYYSTTKVDVGIKSPVCFTPALLEICPRLDENLAPYCYDDFDMSLCALREGLSNILYPIPTLSELEWGGTRKSISFSQNAWRIIARNKQYLYKKHFWLFDKK